MSWPTGHLSRQGAAWAALLVMCLASSAADATVRSRSQRAEFVRQNPCPVTGKRYGPCRGWEVDHRVPLKCGGADAPENMQWLTVQQHKDKTRREAGFCRRGRLGSG